MYFVDLPQPNKTEMKTLAEFPTQAQALIWAQENLGADENGNINVISNDGEDETLYRRTYKQCEYEISLVSTSKYEVMITYYYQRTDCTLEAFYSATNKQWNIVGDNKWAKTIDEIITLGLEIAHSRK